MLVTPSFPPIPNPEFASPRPPHSSREGFSAAPPPLKYPLRFAFSVIERVLPNPIDAEN